jgi:hypothetical protein
MNSNRQRLRQVAERRRSIVNHKEICFCGGCVDWRREVTPQTVLSLLDEIERLQKAFARSKEDLRILTNGRFIQS